jgi:predicted dehydrogenase
MSLPAPHWYVIGTKGSITAEKVGGSIQLLAEGMEKPAVLPPVNAIHELYDNLLAACRGKSSPNVTPKQLRASMSLIDAIFASAKSGQAVAPQPAA